MIDFGCVRKPLDIALQSVGFRAKGKRMWVRTIDQAIQLAHLDKSSYGPQNRLEIYVKLGTETDARGIKLGNFDTVIRVERIIECKGLFRSALDQEAIDMPEEARRLAIDEVIAEIAPVLQLASNKAGFLELRSRFPSPNDVFIGPKTRAALAGG